MSDTTNQPSSTGADNLSSSSNPQKPAGNQGIRLPPISFLSNLPQLQNNTNNTTGNPNERQSPIQSILNSTPSSDDNPQQLSMHPPPSSGLSGYLNDENPIDKFKSRPPLLNDLLSSNDNDKSRLQEQHKIPPLSAPQTDDQIIKYYSEKYEIFDFTDEEKHDILQHEKRSRIEAFKNPNYKPFLCYSIIKRLNAVQPAKKTEEALKEQERKSQEEKLVEQQQAQPEKRKEEEVSTKFDQPPKKFVKREIIINSNDVLSFASKFSRKRLGSLIYTPYPLRSSYDHLPFYDGPKAQETKHNELVPLLPELRDHINSIITVRIPSYHLTDIRNNPHYIKRSIWGTDVYTDDSDILLILKHNGFLPVIDEEFEIETETKDTKQTPGNKDNKQNISQSVKNFRQFINIIGGDIHVDLIVLPTLDKYQGIYRHGINSRSWLTGHDGVSIALYGVRYGEKNSALESVNSGEVKKAKLREFLELSDESKYESYGDNGWKLSYKAWKNAKEGKQQDD